MGKKEPPVKLITKIKKMNSRASLVPVISFGELDLFDQPPNPPGSKLRRWQEFVKNVTGIAAAKFIGRGFFQYTYGMIPRRKPVFTVGKFDQYKI